ncbi:MAG: MFS transporter [Caulobacteraceae bacterium]
MPRRGLFTYENALVLILGLTFGVVFFDRQAASNLMPFIKPDLHMNNTEVGMIGSALSVTWALSAYLVGLLSDRTGQRKLVLIVCVVGFSLCSFLSGLSHSFAMLAVSRLLMGMLEGGVMPICLAIMTLESSERRRALNAGIVQNGLSNLIGNSVGPVVLVVVAQAFTWRHAFYLSALPGLLSALAIWLWVKEPAKDAFDGPGGKAAHVGLLQMLAVRNVAVCSAVSVFMVSWLVTGFAFLPTFFVEFRGWTPAAAAGVMGALGFAAFFFGALAPAASDRFGRKPVLVVGCFASALAPLAALYFHGPVGFLAVLMFIGWVGNGIFPIFMGAVPGESLPRAQIATAMGIVVGVGEILGGVFGPIVAGRIADATSIKLEAPMLVMTVCSVAAGLLCLLLKETAPARLSDAVANRQAADALRREAA